MNNEFTRMQKLAGILTEGYQGTDSESSTDMALNMVKTGAGISGTDLPEVKKKMTKMEAKKMIKDAILAEMHPEDPDEMESAAWDMAMREEDTIEEAVSLNVSRAAKQIYSYIKKEGFSAGLDLDGKRIGNLKEAGGNFIVSVHDSNNIGVKGYGEDKNKLVTQLEGLKNDVLKSFPFITRSTEVETGVVGPGIKVGFVYFGVDEKLMKTGAITEATPDAMNRMDSLVDQNAKFTLVKTVRSIIRDLKMEDFEDDDIFDYIMDLVKTLPDAEGSYYDADEEQDDDTVPVPMDGERPLGEAKKDEEEVEIKDKETVEEPAADEDMIDADMEGGMDMDAGSDEAKTAFDELTDAYRSAKELGDEKLIRQLANTITYFNKNIILK